MTMAGNNPGNLRVGINWDGLDTPPSDEHGFCRFVTLAKGCVALYKNIRNQQILHGLNTVGAIIDKYAPPSENNTAVYKTVVANHLGVPEAEIDTRKLNLSDPDTLFLFGQAVSHHETGDTIDENVLRAAVDVVLNGAQDKVGIMADQKTTSISQTAATSLGTAAGGGVLLWLLACIKGHELIMPDQTTALILSGSLAPFLHALGRSILKKLGGEENPTQPATGANQ